MGTGPRFSLAQAFHVWDEGSLTYPALFSQWRKARHDIVRLQAHGYHLAEETHDVLLVVGSVWVARDVAVLVAADAILVDHPFQGGPIAEAVVEASGGTPASVRKSLYWMASRSLLSFIASTRQSSGASGFSTCLSGYAFCSS